MSQSSSLEDPVLKRTRFWVETFQRKLFFNLERKILVTSMTLKYNTIHFLIIHIAKI